MRKCTFAMLFRLVTSCILVLDLSYQMDHIQMWFFVGQLFIDF